jgi:hypothetical protein
MKSIAGSAICPAYKHISMHKTKYATTYEAVIYLDWIQNRLVLDPMQSYTSLGRYLAKLGRS